ncbi:MAG TPA: hypothetical protein PLV61_00965 [Parvularculaceae bacterium]|nr:hypothetical protein [Caulobacterales bacterium]HOP19360.1 hypothetical protein [Amphiplicatus sp.]HPE29727.1 hypothetical protein [Parvularculaceae bacterium]HRX39384.1 hypothetical protein [Parvularculaceae bacterium]
MNFDASPGALVASALVATAGLWWFRRILQEVRRLPAPTRIGIYVLVWLAYFVLTMVLAARTMGAA